MLKCLQSKIKMDSYNKHILGVCNTEDALSNHIDTNEKKTN